MPLLDVELVAIGSGSLASFGSAPSRSAQRSRRTADRAKASCKHGNPQRQAGSPPGRSAGRRGVPARQASAEQVDQRAKCRGARSARCRGPHQGAEVPKKQSRSAVAMAWAQRGT